MVRNLASGYSGNSNDDCHVLQHPSYSDNPDEGLPNDIATLQLESPLVFNSFLNALPIDNGTKTLSRYCVLAGWGRTGVSVIAVCPTDCLSALSTARKFFFSNFYHPGLFTFIFLNPSSLHVLLALVVTNGGSWPCGPLK